MTQKKKKTQWCGKNDALKNDQADGINIDESKGKDDAGKKDKENDEHVDSNSNKDDNSKEQYDSEKNDSAKIDNENNELAQRLAVTPNKKMWTQKHKKHINLTKTSPLKNTNIS